MINHMLTTEQVNKIKTQVLADKHEVSTSYVRKILLGIRKTNSAKASAIMRDAHKLVQSIERIQSTESLVK